MKIKAVVFDFNGTLFWDTKLHDDAWDMFLAKKGMRLSEQGKKEKIHGRHNEDILNSVFRTKLTREDIETFSIEKEQVYRDICSETDMLLMHGAIEFFMFLKSCRIPFTIATGSERVNVDFYFEQFQLDAYFDYSKVVYNDGKILGKPHPQIFEKAFKIMGVKGNETLIFEDSVPGIEAAESAGAGIIIIVDSNNNDLGKWNYQKIKSFFEVDKSLFR
jgi:HAD superfamily hydrolase (TIGR01509 family)